MVNANDATVSGAYEYGPFGNTIKSTGSIATFQPFKFSTKYQDAETDLIDFGYRFYKADMGNWLTRDNIGEVYGINIYSFINNDSLNSVDSFGLRPLAGNPTGGGRNPPNVSEKMSKKFVGSFE